MLRLWGSCVLGIIHIHMGLLGLLGLLAGATEGRILGLRLCLALHTGRSFDLEGVWQACGVLRLKVFSSTNSLYNAYHIYGSTSTFGFQNVQSLSKVGACGCRYTFCYSHIFSDIHFSFELSKIVCIQILKTCTCRPT